MIFGHSRYQWQAREYANFELGFLLGIEELSNQMEEPFSILPQEKMCNVSIRTPVMEQVLRPTVSI